MWVLFAVCLVASAVAQEEGQYDPEQQLTYRGRPVRPRPERPYQEGPPRPYSFSYVAPSDLGQHTRQESGDGSGRVQGSYSLQDEDGRRRVVEYVADIDGFRANVQTNEPGTDSQNPADVVFQSTYSGSPGVVAGGSPAIRPRPRPRPSSAQIERLQHHPSSPQHYHPSYYHAPYYADYGV